MITSDFLVIGSGVAGLSFALRAAEHGKVIVLCKSDPLVSSSAKAQGGIAAVMSSNDSFEEHIADTLDAGAGLCDEAAVRTIVTEAPEAIRELLAWGVDFDQEKDGEFELGREGGHGKRRILHAKDTTGLEISSKLLACAQKHPNIEILDHRIAIDLITTAKLGCVTEDRVLGAYVLNPATGEVDIFRCDRVMLATGGTGRVYMYTTNPPTATGDGVAMAWRAGANISNMEFVQFHPTTFYNPKSNDREGLTFLISEAVRGEGGVLRGPDGQEFMQKYDARKSLAPRDIVARAINSEILRTGHPCMYLDMTHKPKGFMAERFPYIYETCKSYGVDAEVDMIPIVPSAHYQCGGAQTDTNGQTTLRGLFCAGESACTGLHGANRLASNSLLECVVITKRAIASMLTRLPLAHKMEEYPIPEWVHGNKAERDDLAILYHCWDEVRRTMTDYVSIVRTNHRLQRAATRLRNINREINEYYWGYRVTPEIIDLRNLALTASLIVDCAIRRQESRGLHYTLDAPEKLPVARPSVIHNW
ncbi:MAG TPA: L-aspartate oxidase [Candidatus Akkermansia intestinigallinarum]|uniref:L-aspartate oxidase n=1 Tax=Candidatus Akkermansia intestinigallinarum TaxID=2838431 RepID=A0A9D1V9W4_9BACT|nr:L-aspartate oxidase [Candidatus Akkermansia intestinigallinarum]